MLKTELLYFITEMRSGWVVHCEKLLYGPFPRFRDAMGRAVSEAESTVSLGFRSAVLVENEIGAFGMEWTSDNDPYGTSCTRTVPSTNSIETGRFPWRPLS